jgi:hypothetical protein
VVRRSTERIRIATTPIKSDLRQADAQDVTLPRIDALRHSTLVAAV